MNDAADIIAPQPHLTWKLETETEFNNAEDTVFSKHQKYLDAALAVMKTADQEDKQVAKEKRREKRQMLKAKAKGVPKEEAVAYLGQASDDDANDYESAGEERRDDASFGDNSDAGEDFDIDLNEDDDVVSAPPPPAPIKKLKAKKRKQAAAVDTVADDLDDGSDDLKPKRARKTISSINIQDMANEEELALKLLQASR